MRHFIALLFSIFGVVATVVVVIAINEAPPLKKRDLSSQQVSFSTPPPPKQIASKPKPKPKPKAAARSTTGTHCDDWSRRTVFWTRRARRCV